MSRPFKNILVTGGCGFIGSNFINYMLSESRHDVFILNIDRLDYCASEDNIYQYIQEDNSKYKFVHTDINNREKIIECLYTYSIDIIIHFAAQSHVDNSFGNSIQFTIDNILGTHTLLECAKEYRKLSLFLHFSTDEVYGEVDIDHIGCTEKSLLNPTNPYAASKAGAEFIVRSYYHSFKLPIIITRGNNVYGPRQYPEKLIPRFITRLLKGEKCQIHGKGESRRNFIYTDDVSRAVETILTKGVVNEIYNIGSTDEYSVLEVLEHTMKEMDITETKEEISEFIQDRCFNDQRYFIQADKLESLGWKRQISFEDGLKKTIEWYTNYADGKLKYCK